MGKPIIPSEERHKAVTVHEFCVVMATERLMQKGGNPASSTYTFERVRDGKVFTYCGVAPVIDGETATFVLNEDNLHSIRPA